MSRRWVGYLQSVFSVSDSVRSCFVLSLGVGTVSPPPHQVGALSTVKRFLMTHHTASGSGDDLKSSRSALPLSFLLT